MTQYDVNYGVEPAHNKKDKTMIRLINALINAFMFAAFPEFSALYQYAVIPACRPVRDRGNEDDRRL